MVSHSDSRFLYLTTKGWKTGQEHEIEISFVKHNDKYYIMSETMDKAHWVQNIMHDPNVKFTIKDNTFSGTARIVNKINDPQLEIKILEFISSKPVSGLIVELNPL
ncbi:MAG: nitroreductase/quinone reductase family protein [Candidatus Nitrosocosmicus sp.]